MKNSIVKIISLTLLPFMIESAAIINYNEILINAAKSGNLKQLNYALNNGANVSYAREGKFTALHFVAYHGYKDAVNILIKAGANINAKNKHLETPLMTAIHQQHFDIIMELLKHKANVNIQNNAQSTGLHIATSLNNYKIVCALLKAGALVNLKNFQKCTPITYAIICQHTHLILPLLNAGSVVSNHQVFIDKIQHLLRIDNAKGILLTYIFTNQVNKIKKILSYKQSLDIINYNFENTNGTPLIFAACRGNFEIVKILSITIIILVV